MPHKRHVIGIAAVNLARTLSGEDFRLTMVGPKGAAEHEVLAALHDADPYQRWTARKVNVSDEELQAIYESSWLLLQPSCMEGYGLPVGEAASIGVPVLHSGLGALSEVAPRAVRDPEDPTSYATEICLLLDKDQYTKAVADSLVAARRHTETRFANTVRRALTRP